MIVTPASGPRRERAAAARASRGLSLVELLVGLSVGLLGVAAATAVLASQLQEQRRLLLETQVQQDLRAAVDLISRELRRAGAMTPADATASISLDGSRAQPSRWTSLDIAPQHNAVRFQYDRGLGGADYGFRVESGAIRTRIGGTWQALTDPAVLRVTDLSIRAETATHTLSCPQLCQQPPTGTIADTACWPALQTRSLVVSVSAHPVADARMTRSLQTRVRLRNDAVLPGTGGTLCP